MEQNPLPPAKKNSDFPMTQPINKDVMELVANKGKPKADPKVEKAMAQLKEIMAKNNIQPQILVEAGKMADAALKDKSLYPMVVEMAVKQGLITPDQIKPGGDARLLAGASTAGKLAQMMIDQGK
jgi:hypothetical protein